MTKRSIVVTGATGYLGGLVVESLLANEDCRLLLPVRSHHDPETVLAGFESSCQDDVPVGDRVTVLPIDDFADEPSLLRLLGSANVARIVHCAGCVDYFDDESLHRGNFLLTKTWLKVARSLSVERFEYLSTAFSCGYLNERVPESLHYGSAGDPTDYTRSKRDTECLVAEDGVPFTIYRPAVVIGHSETGAYGGKRYGLYQLWGAAERLLCTAYVPVIHAIAPRTRLHVVHEDAFGAAFLAGHRHLPEGSILHIVSREETLPTVRDVWDLWLGACSHPREIHYYQRLADVPRDKLDRRQRFWLEFTSVNVDISTYDWRFETTGLDWLRDRGLAFADATAHTIGLCQDRFFRDSERVQTFLREHGEKRHQKPEVFEYQTGEPDAAPIEGCAPSAGRRVAVPVS